LTTRGAEHIYVYYRLVGEAGAAHAAVAAVFADLEARTGISGRLLERREPPCTWMEVYEPVTQPAAFLRLLAAAVRRHGLAAFAADSGRALERFAAPLGGTARDPTR
jgi:hypothetical protein